MPITAAQLIYANVEKDRSPNRQGGFQTLFHTRARLTEAEVDAIEPRLFYVPGNAAPPKGLAFPLGTDKLVLARIVPLSETDRFGRKGGYLAHALICERADWIAARLDPCAVLAAFPFLTDLGQALAAGDPASGYIAPVTLDPPPVPARPWPAALLQRLTLYALRAADLAAERRALALIGPPGEVEQTVAAVLAAVPAALAPACSFDSDFNDGNFTATPYWAVGLPEAPPPGRYVRLDLAAGAWLDSEPAPAPRTAYEHWAVARLAATGIAPERETAYTLCRWLDGELGPADLPETVPEPLLAAVFRAAPTQAERRVHARLTQALPPVLADLIWPAMQPQRTDPERYAELRHGFALPPLADRLWGALTRPAARPPAPPIRRALTDWLPASPHPGLDLLTLAWNGQWQALQAALTTLNAAAYESRVPILLRLGGAPPLRLLAPGRGGAFVRAWLPEREGAPVSLAELAATLLEWHEGAALNAIAPLLQDIQPRELRALEQVVAPHAADLPLEFAQALNAVLAQPSTAGVLTGLKRWWHP